MDIELIVILAFAFALAIVYIPAVLYFKNGWFRKFFHDTLQWHMPDSSPKWYDGCSSHCKCKYCGSEIMQDSQGNWF